MGSGGANLIDLTGQRFGRLTVIERAGNKRQQAGWLCHCECGTEKIIAGGNLRRSNGTKSCGCLRLELLAERTLPEGEASFNEMIRSMRHNAKKRGYEWALTKEQVRILTKQPCHYCGADPSQCKHKPNANGDYIYNGIDRIDNSKGYEIGNVVSCCKDCNYAKRAMTIGEFRAWAIRLYEHFASI